jgi:hypothetical protein
VRPSSWSTKTKPPANPASPYNLIRRIPPPESDGG